MAQERLEIPQKRYCSDCGCEAQRHASGSSSWDCLSLVRSRKFGSGAAKSVMLLIAARCGQDWSCFVGQKRLACESEYSERTIRAIEADFEERRLISRRKRYAGSKGRTSDTIVLNRRAIEALPIIEVDLLPANAAAIEDQPATDVGLPADDDDLPATASRSTGNVFRVTTRELPVVTSRASAQHDDASVASLLDAPLGWDLTDDDLIGYHFDQPPTSREAWNIQHQVVVGTLSDPRTHLALPVGHE